MDLPQHLIQLLLQDIIHVDMDLPQHLIQLLLYNIIHVDLYGLASTSYTASPVRHYTCRYGLASTSYKASPVGHYVDMDLPQHLIKLLLQDIMQIWTCLNILYSFSCRTLCRYGLASTSYTASPVGHYVDMDLPQHLIKLLLQDIIHVDMDLPQHLIQLLLQDIMQIWTCLNILYSFSCRTLYMQIWTCLNILYSFSCMTLYMQI